ncbi:MAG: YicC family protein [Bacteroidales bacterium]|jgi:uncharacterized protein (TIGR00255 family)|nr:YicC family protein [Bacteroidales bacterium]HHT53079.1 YicC family protein [Bacteroidales bacterium]
MIKSMTGFGKTSTVVSGKMIVIEIKTLNSKQLDISTRIMPAYREKELEIRNWVAQSLERGKIEVSIYQDKINSAEQTVEINFDLAKEYYQQLKNLSQFLNNEVQSDLLIQVLRMPDVITAQKEELDEECWILLKDKISETCNLVNQFRVEEGAVLQKDLTQRVHLIMEFLNAIDPFENERMQQIRNKLNEALQVADLSRVVDPNRFEQEMIYYLEKWDITEEKVRLKKHCNYFLDTLNAAESQGKKLGFITQEMGREINTIGSKCNLFEIQQLVVQMKEEVEKIKEQLANIL